VKYCKICSKPNEDRAKFCGGCGTRLTPEKADSADDEFAKLFEVSETADTTEHSELFAVAPEETNHAAQDAPAADSSSNELGAQELEQLFETSDSEDEAAAEDVDIEQLFGDAEPLSDRRPDSLRMQAVGGKPENKDEIDAAFERLLAQKESDGQSSSPAERLVSEEGVLSEAKRELASNQPEAAISAQIADELLDEAPEEPPTPETDEQESAPAHRPRQPVRRKLPSSLKRARLVPKPTFSSRMAALAGFLTLTALLGDGAVHIFALTIPLPWVIAPVVGLLIAYLVKRVSKAEHWPLSLANLLMFALLVGLSFDPLGIVPSTGAIAGLGPAALRPLTMTLVVILGVFFVIRSRLLLRPLRYVTASLGVYSLVGLLTGIAAGRSYGEIISRRSLNLIEGSAADTLIRQLLVGFEPTFVAVNCFIPLLVIILFFEASRLFINRFWAEGIHLLIACAIFAATLFFNMPLYEKHGIPSLRTLAGVVEMQEPSADSP